MYQFFVDDCQIGKEYVTITGSDVNHIKNVLRMRPGEKIRVSSSSRDMFCEIAELPDDLKASLQATLFQHENAKELKTAKKLSSVSAVLLLAILGLTIAFGLKYTPALAAKNVPLFGYNLVMPAEEVSDHLGYIDGLRNGALVFGHAVVEIFVGAFYDYVDGFSYGFIGNIIWAFLGIVWELVKYMFLAIARYFVTIVLAFFQRATLGYYVGYIISAAISRSSTLTKKRRKKM